MCSSGRPSSCWTFLTSFTLPVYCHVSYTSHTAVSISLQYGDLRFTLPTSSESLTQSLPLIRFSLITMLSGVDGFERSDFFWKSFVRNVPIPNEAIHYDQHD